MPLKASCRVPLALVIISCCCWFIVDGTGSGGHLFVWSQNDWDLLADQFSRAYNTTHRAADRHGNDSTSCENGVSKVWISIPPDSNDKTVLRPQVDTHRVNAISPQRIRAMAEFHFDSWAALVRDGNYTWPEVGCEFRRRMCDAGYEIHQSGSASGSSSSEQQADTDLLDTWELNEAPHVIRTNATFRAEFLLVLESLARGCRGLSPGPGNESSSASSSIGDKEYLDQHLPGVLFFAGMGQRTRYLGEYKEELKQLLADDDFWFTSQQYVAVYSFETYTDPSSVCDSALSAEHQVCLIGGYVSHVWRLAAAGGNISRMALEALSGSSALTSFRYLPTMGSVFGCDDADMVPPTSPWSNSPTSSSCKGKPLGPAWIQPYVTNPIHGLGIRLRSQCWPQ